MKKLAAIILIVISLFYLATEAEAQSAGRPSAPTNVQASDGTYTDKVQITWTASPGATSYTVYRATQRWGTKTALGTTSDTTYDDTTALAGKIYYYYIKATNANGTSNFSASDTGSRSEGTPPPGGTPPPPTNVQASDGTYMDKVQVTWTASPGATSYTVYRATQRWGTKTALGTTSDTTYDDTTALAGKIYYYYIKATNAYGTSDFSVYDTGWWRGPDRERESSIQGNWRGIHGGIWSHEYWLGSPGLF